MPSPAQPLSPLQPRPADAGETAPRRRQAGWLKILYRWHWISSALCLVGLMLFALTGITLNNAAHFEAAQPRTHTQQAQLPRPLREALQQNATAAGEPLATPLRDWLEARFGLDLRHTPADWQADAVSLDLQTPGVDAWLRIDRATGEVALERTDRGWVAYLNDLHKGRHAGTGWSWFLDVFALAALLSSLTGLLILQQHAARRPLVWPLTALGAVLPALLACLLVH